MHRAKEFGLSARAFRMIWMRGETVPRGVKTVEPGVAHLLKKNKVTAFMGAATLKGRAG